MPTLKQLTCHIEWAPSNIAFREYGVAYGDGVVESHIAIPDGSTPFTINLKSDGFIAPGLAMFVFIDGVYQCNRHRYGLQISDKAGVDSLSTMANFRVRQKEERLPDGSWIGRCWRFEPLNIVHALNDAALSGHFEHLGTIHVLVLRCLPDTSMQDHAIFDSDSDCPTSSQSETAVIADDEIIHSSHGQVRSEGGLNLQPWAAFDGSGDAPYYKARQKKSREPSCPNPPSTCNGVSNSWRESRKTCRGDWSPYRYDADLRSASVDEHKTASNDMRRARQTKANTSYHVSGSSAYDRRQGTEDTNCALDFDPFDSVISTSKHARTAPSHNSFVPSGTPIVVNINPILSRPLTPGSGYGLQEEGLMGTDDIGRAYPISKRRERHREYNGWRHHEGPGKDQEFQGNHNSSMHNIVSRDIGPAPFSERHQFRKHRQHDGRDSDSHWANTEELWDSGAQARDQAFDSSQTSTGWKPHGEEGFPSEDHDPWVAGSPQMGQGENSEWEHGDDRSRAGVDNDWAPIDSSASSSRNEDWLKDQSWESNDNRSTEDHGWDENKTPDQDSMPGRQSHADEHDPAKVDSWDNSGPKEGSVPEINSPGSSHWHSINHDTGHHAAPSRFNVPVPCGQGVQEEQETLISWPGNQQKAENGSSSSTIQSSKRASSQNQTVLISPLITTSDGNEPSLYTVPSSVAESRLLSHQVQLGNAAEYIHKVKQPTYIDTLEHPYAKFIFKYRTKGAIERLLGIKLERDMDEEKRKLEDIPKEELIAHILRAEGFSAENHSFPGNSHRGNAMPMPGFTQSGTFDMRYPPSTNIACGKSTEEGTVDSGTSASLRRDIWREPRDMTFSSNGHSPTNITEHGRPTFETAYGGKLPKYDSWSTKADQNINASSTSAENNATSLLARKYSTNPQDRMEYPSQVSWETAEPAGPFIHPAGPFAQAKVSGSENSSFQGEVPHNPPSKSYSSGVSRQFSSETSQAQNSGRDDQSEDVSW